MSGKYNLSKQEAFLMDLLWRENRQMTLAEIMDLAQQSGFKPTIGTTKTYLQRLVKKDTLSTYKSGHKLLYFPSMSEEAYKQKWTRSILDSSFEGSLRSFVCALTGNESLTEDQVQQLKDLYDE